VVPAPAIEAALPDLLARLKAQSDKIQTLSATVDFQPTTGSIYTGVIKEYHDVKGFILVKKPAMIRILGQAPVVRTNIFDMVSDGREFRLYIPPKQKFIVGMTTFSRPGKNSLENLRPQHILEALLIPDLNQTEAKLSFEEDTAENRRYYIVTALVAGADGELYPSRRLWFDRTDLNVARQLIYGPRGSELEEAEYSGYQDFQGVSYPSHIDIRRPIEDYRLAIHIEKAKFNQPIEPEKFELKKPASAQLVELSAAQDPKR
jgi:outer membrane lipoprotein-sorting protein